MEAATIATSLAERRFYGRWITCTTTLCGAVSSSGRRIGSGRARLPLKVAVVQFFLIRSLGNGWQTRNVVATGLGYASQNPGTLTLHPAGAGGAGPVADVKDYRIDSRIDSASTTPRTVTVRG